MSYIEKEESIPNKNYQIPEDSEINEKLSQVDTLKREINSLKSNKPELWETIKQKLKMNWTFNSNAIEGSTLTEGDTIFFLQHGLTVEGKPFKDFLDAKNHAEAIDLLHDIIANQREISGNIIKAFNEFLLTGVKSTNAIDQFGQSIQKPATPGVYKKRPNHVLQQDGTIHHYVDPIQVQIEMENLVNWINKNNDTVHPVIIGAVAHYNMVRIHPFDDGNGRGARILMNLILMKYGFPPAIIKNEKRRKYIDCLKSADTGELKPFIEFIIESLTDTLNMILSELENTPIKDTFLK